MLELTQEERNVPIYICIETIARINTQLIELITSIHLEGPTNKNRLTTFMQQIPSF